MNTIQNQICNRCKSCIVTDGINSRNNVAYKSCLTCRDKANKKCPHEKQKSRCVDCGGSEICPPPKTNIQMPRL